MFSKGDSNFHSFIFKRRSVRQFTDKPVERQLLELLIKAGMAAPSAANKQPWDFVVITDREMLSLLAEQLPYAKMLFSAPAAIVVCGNKQRALPAWDSQFWIQDCSAASQNILLAATSLGLGSVWTAVYPDLDRVRCVVDALSLPDYVLPLNVIPIGYPVSEEVVNDRWDEKKLHWEKW